MSLALATLRPTAPPPVAALARLPGRASAWLAAWRAGAPAFFAADVLLLVAALPLAAAAPVDGRTVLGADAWLKPLRLAVALGIRAFSLALFSRAPAPGLAGRRGFRATVIFAVRAELAWIAGGASHAPSEPVRGKGPCAPLLTGRDTETSANAARPVAVSVPGALGWGARIRT